jgi:superfamily II DNA or RNA helicase
MAGENGFSNPCAAFVEKRLSRILLGKESTRYFCPFAIVPPAYLPPKPPAALSLTDLVLKKKLEANKGKNLYGYQENAINTLMARMDKFPDRYNLLFQLPTGGGKTVIFSELAKRYILKTGKRVLILTHRIELCGQTSRMLTDIGIPNKIINSKVKELDEDDDHWCFVAMVETLNNRLNDERIEFENLGLVGH